MSCFWRRRTPRRPALSRETDGFVFNQGPHALYNGGALRRWLAEFGVRVTGGPPPFRQPAALWGDRLFPLPLGPADHSSPPRR